MGEALAALLTPGRHCLAGLESVRERRTCLSVNCVERVYTHYPWDVSNGHLNEPPLEEELHVRLPP